MHPSQIEARKLLDDLGIEIGFAVRGVNLLNFRGFRDLEIEFSNNLTVIIGNNGAGKTTILEAIRISLTWLEARIANLKSRGARIAQEDIHQEADLAKIDLSFSYRYDDRVDSIFKRWVIGAIRKGSGLSNSGLSEFMALNDVAKSFSARKTDLPGTIHPLPILVHYSVGRSVVDVPRRIRKRHNYTRIDTYEGALTDGKADFRRFFEWFREREDEELEQIHRSDKSYEDRGLEATRTAISNIMPGYSKPFIRRKGNEMILKKEGAELSVNQLSDGERTLITMVADLARRLAMATDSTPLHDKPLYGYGTVLIDEIELHLHPDWQQQVLTRLTDTFPNLQFIVTTHSPLVLSTLPKESIRILQTIPAVNSPYPDRILSKPSIQSEGVSADEILRAVMDVDPEPDLPINQDAERFEILVQAGELDSERVLALEEKLKVHYGEASQTFQSLISTKRLYERRERIKAMRGQ